ncbi:MAG: AbrB/MazE/SpoVT family DNA-binding domain-containing protein [Deltaproteobacteria bacterium]|jgi:antitoxin PrlF|nr:AbrB/MazE/SpoVT family DNA-binding domain-containing protein [Deltaproteobacteria bacterium]MBT4526791.1 AbrB/MazE/SpoVT family DNA-binding domain-containing protein [Deltaproteobacteria bacterium]
MKAIVAERGQVTIPKKIRDRLGITAKTVLEFQENNGKIIVSKSKQEDPITKVIGCLKIEKNTDQIISELRDSE